MQGESVSEEDQKAFDSLAGCEKVIQESGRENIVRWYYELKSLMTEEQGQCSYCQKRINVTMLRIMIAGAKSPDAIIPCEGCKGHHTNLLNYEQKLMGRKFIKGD
jgi:hypothetical protein